jgi:hypothetical protein
MTFLETWLAISPDGGNGAAEAMLAGGLLLLLAMCGWYCQRARFGKLGEGRLESGPQVINLPHTAGKS